MAAVTSAAGAISAPAQRSATVFEWSGCSVQVSTSLARLEPAWRELEPLATASMFQGWDYVNAWCRNCALAVGEAPLFVVGRGDGAVQFILPMALIVRAGTRVLTWLGQRHSNYGMGLFHPDLLGRLEAGEVDALVIDVARRVGAAVVHLDNQPARWAGKVNPFAASPCSFVTANDTFVARLGDDFQARYKHLFSGRTLSGLKRKQRKLEEMGAVSFAAPADLTARHAVIDWFFAHKRVQLAQDGRNSQFDEAAIQDLYRALARDEAHFDVDQLRVGDTLVAMGMTAFAGQTAYLLNTVHAGLEYARCSPGALLLHRMVAQAHRKGARVYDFGPGMLPYKLEWEPEVIPLLSTTCLVKPSGLPVHAILVFTVLAKARIKRNAWTSEIVRKVRRWLARGSTG